MENDNGWSFIIITDGSQGPRLKTVVESVVREVPENRRDIIVVGGYSIDKELIDRYDVYFVPFDEREHPGAISWKKNIGVSCARFEKVVVLHDYLIVGDHNWLSSWDAMRNEWDVGINVIENLDGSRFRDHCSWGDPRIPPGFWQFEPWCPQGLYHSGTPALMNYDDPNPHWFISGAAFIIKKKIYMENPLPEYLKHSMGEDVWMSLRLRELNYRYIFNKNTKFKLLKQKDVIIRNAFHLEIPQA